MGYVRPRGFEHGHIFVWSDGVFTGMSERLGPVFDRLRQRRARGPPGPGFLMTLAGPDGGSLTLAGPARIYRLSRQGSGRRGVYGLRPSSRVRARAHFRLE